MKAELLLAEFLGSPLAMTPDRVSALASLLANGAVSGNSAPEPPEGAAGPRGTRVPKLTARNAPLAQRHRAVLVLPIHGVIVQRPDLLMALLGGTATKIIAQELRNAMADETVDAVVLDIDSPGGSVYGVAELAEEIYQARARKPVVAIANSLAASAAYWLGAAAAELYITPGGEVGSIGVVAVHEDLSALLDHEGIKTTLVSAGKFKTEGNPFEPLPTDARNFIQTRVDDYYGAFTRAVARGRGVPVAVARSGMGSGRVLGASAALAENMVDGIKTFDQVLKAQLNVSAAPRLRASQMMLKALAS